MLFPNLPDPVKTSPSENPLDSDPFGGCADIKEFATKVLNSVYYRQSLLRRILLDELPAAVEQLLYYYAVGKPTERVEHTGRDGQPFETIVEVRRVIVPVDVNYDDDVQVTRH